MEKKSLRPIMVCVRVAFLVSLLLLVSTGFVHSTKVDRSTSSIVEGKHAQVRLTHHRKLLNDTDPGGSKRIGRAGRCSIDSISLYQGQTDPLPSGIPTYTVRIMNTCYSRCNISDIHLRCGDFSSTVLIDPTIFRRIEPGNCLVNDGGILGPDEIVTFKYANSFMYPLSVWRVKC